MNIKQVSLRRKEIKAQLPPKVIADSKRYLASVMSGRGPLKGVEGDEEKKLLGDYLGIDPYEKGWNDISTRFWAELRVEVPIDGTILDISTDSENNPLNSRDYLIFKWAQRHPEVTDSKQKMLNDPQKSFYVHDPDKELSNESQAVNLRMEAYKEFARISGKKKADLVLRILADRNPDTMSTDQKQIVLEKMLNDAPEKFIKVATDKNLEIHGEIEEMISAGVLRKVANKVYFIDEKIGESTDEAILFFKDAKNSSTLITLRGKLEETTKATA